MDPLSLIVQELRRAEEEAAKYEKCLSRFEARQDFDANDEVYRRIADEKQIVLRSAVDLRSKLTDQGYIITLFGESCAVVSNRCYLLFNSAVQRSVLSRLRGRPFIEWRAVSFRLKNIVMELIVHDTTTHTFMSRWTVILLSGQNRRYLPYKLAISRSLSYYGRLQPQ